MCNLGQYNSIPLFVQMFFNFRDLQKNRSRICVHLFIQEIERGFRIETLKTARCYMNFKATESKLSLCHRGFELNYLPLCLECSQSALYTTQTPQHRSFSIIVLPISWKGMDSILKIFELLSSFISLFRLQNSLQFSRIF